MPIYTLTKYVDEVRALITVSRGSKKSTARCPPSCKAPTSHKADAGTCSWHCGETPRDEFNKFRSFGCRRARQIVVGFFSAEERLHIKSQLFYQACLPGRLHQSLPQMTAKAQLRHTPGPRSYRRENFGRKRRGHNGGQ